MEILIALALTAGIIGLAGRIPDQRKVKRELAMASRHGFAKVTSLRENTTAVVRGRVARVHETELIRAPASGRACVFSLVTFDELGAGGDYVEIGRHALGQPFLLETPTGAVRVVPDHPRIALPGEVVLITASSILAPSATHPAAPELASHPLLQLARRVCRRPNHPGLSSLRITEYVLLPGAEVTIKGYCTREPDPTVPTDAAGYRAELPMRPVISGTRKVPLVIG